MLKTSSKVAGYIRALDREIKHGNATEHTLRPALKDFIEAVGGKEFLATNEPKRVKCGAPDYIITRGITPIGHIEAKDIGVDLDKVETTDQMRRYLESLDNLILTDYLEFRWYVLGKPRQTAKIGEVKNGKVQVYAGADDGLALLLEAFLTSQTPTVSSPKELAQRMAGIAKIIRDAIKATFEEEKDGGPLHDQLEGFRDILLHNLNPEQFADMYAQTLCYGLFAARCNHQGDEPFTRRNAGRDLPKTNPFLKKLFQHIALELEDDGELPFVWAVDDLAELLNRSRMDEILADFGKHTRQEDPVVHFYETFLREYDPKLREMRGVYYTPEPVVSYIVRSVDEILKTRFNLKEGLSSREKVTLTLTPEATSKKAAKEEHKQEFHKVQILDPATGTGTFLYSVIQHIFNSVGSKNAGMWSGYVRDHLLPRVYGFELLMASYAVAHLKLGLLLRETGYDFKDDERLNVFLTNTLEEPLPFSGLPMFSSFLAHEANQASNVKKNVPVMVVLGNPPYSVDSLNKGKWIEDQIRANYYPNDETKEANPKVLLDDYVKFIRFSQERIERTGHGVLAFITNHGYLDNPTFRRMRQSLMKTFDEIYVLDLHGNAKKKETCPDGGPDKNVFDIQQGVAIGIFVKGPNTSTECKVYRGDLWGVREEWAKDSDEKKLIGGKYYTLSNTSMTATDWKTCLPKPPFYLFDTQSEELINEYQQGVSLTKVFPLNSTGVKTHRDHFVFDFDASLLEKRLNEFRDLTLPDQEIVHRYGLKDTRDWQLSQRRKDLATLENWKDYFCKALYRPFDFRAYYHHEFIVELPRNEVMRHFFDNENIGLSICRQQASIGFQHALVAETIIESCYVSNKTREITYILPLYLYADSTSGNLFDSQQTGNPGGRRANLDGKFTKQFAKAVKLKFVDDGRGDMQKTFGPEDVFYYIYAVLHSPAYRTRYAEFLKMDFPRVPLPSCVALFRELVPLGYELAQLHLMETQGPAMASYRVEGSNMVDAPRYVEPSDAHPGRVYINATQYFEGVPPEVWAFQVGGYQVCHKWLKDRKGRTLSFDDLTHYQQIVSALSETIRLMAAVDAVIDGHGGWPIEPKDKSA
ncbi:MAG TPA: type ISP restriction/modification enzyme [Coleofasciculaceae cyanobacterium]|jgi:predicted helicase